MPQWSQTWTWFEGRWHEGNAPILGPRDHAFWLGSSVFDGARAFEGVMPDLDQHLARVNRSAEAMLMTPTMSVEGMTELVKEGVRKFGPQAALYIRPMYWPEEGAASAVEPLAESTRFALCLYEAPMPAGGGSAITVSPFRRPTQECAPLNAKAGCLYPNNARAIREARSRGFDNAILNDMLGNAAELATANVFLGKDGVVMTPVANGTFLAGVTRRRVMGLLRESGVTMLDTTLTYRDFLAADEIFSVGNYGKVQPITRIDDRALQPGPLYRRARELYWDFAHSG